MDEEGGGKWSIGWTLLGGTQCLEALDTACIPPTKERKLKKNKKERGFGISFVIVKKKKR